jgi:hypothetical protein
MTEIDIQPQDRAVFDRLKSTGRITHGLRRSMTQQWNKCGVCGGLIPKGRPAFAGFGVDHAPLLVGACCGDRLVELATPVYWSDTLNLSVEDSQQVWRYMDFAKFVAMLQQRGLYFPRADKLEDRFEGAIGLARREEDWNRFYLDYFRSIVVTAPPGYPSPVFSEDKIESEAKRLLAALKSSSSERSHTLVSCWHANLGESEALWRLYCPTPTPGVAIRATVGRLWDATAQHSDTVVGRVHYVDFRRSFSTIQRERFFCKRLSLSHENEVRAVLYSDHKSVAGEVIACDLDALIEEAVVSPFAPSWFSGVVSGTIEKFGYTFKVRQSELLDEPFY